MTHARKKLILGFHRVLEFDKSDLQLGRGPGNFALHTHIGLFYTGCQLIDAIGQFAQLKGPLFTGQGFEATGLHNLNHLGKTL